jgi:hypothetical protein
VEGAHALRCGLQRGALRFRQRGQGRIQFGLADIEVRHRGGLHAVELVGVFQHRVVAAGAYVADDPADRAFDGVVGLGFESQQRIERFPEIVLGGVELADHDWAFASEARSKASMIGCRRARFSLSAAWLTTRREEMSMISSTSTR